MRASFKRYVRSTRIFWDRRNQCKDQEQSLSQRFKTPEKWGSSKLLQQRWEIWKALANATFQLASISNLKKRVTLET
ncbi:hypothetical protein KIN20_019699 [Parelaphostrongylus tenuis]|uniref:Uncharacterized protein n=1 Tax=Parelaphostrongylus tenuis TaxID=148309 RepID=A0AAD5QSM2_PARTN|nr:hypothetical protein KIN20_019699 [Parelaphostrongylus tenuis]